MKARTSELFGTDELGLDYGIGGGQGAECIIVVFVVGDSRG